MVLTESIRRGPGEDPSPRIAAVKIRISAAVHRFRVQAISPYEHTLLPRGHSSPHKQGLATKPIIASASGALAAGGGAGEDRSDPAVKQLDFLIQRRGLRGVTGV